MSEDDLFLLLVVGAFLILTAVKLWINGNEP